MRGPTPDSESLDLPREFGQKPVRFSGGRNNERAAHKREAPAPGNRLWGIGVVPESPGDLTLAVRAMTDGTVQHAACGAGGRTGARLTRIRMSGERGKSRAPELRTTARGPRPGRVLRLAAACAFLLTALGFSVSAEAADTGPATGYPSIAGSPFQGQVIDLTRGSIDDPDGIRPYNMSFAFYRCDANGDNCDTRLAYHPETTFSVSGFYYTITAADVGHRIRGEVGFRDSNGGNYQTRRTYPWPPRTKDPIAAAVSCAAPTPTGRSVIWRGSVTVGEAGISTFENYFGYKRENYTGQIGYATPTKARTNTAVSLLLAASTTSA